MKKQKLKVLEWQEGLHSEGLTTITDQTLSLQKYSREPLDWKSSRMNSGKKYSEANVVGEL